MENSNAELDIPEEPPSSEANENAESIEKENTGASEELLENALQKSIEEENIAATEELLENAPENFDNSKNLNSSVESVDVGVNVTSGDLQFSFSSMISCDRELSACTGIESLEILDCLVRMARVLEPVGREKISLIEKIVMTFVKLKQNCTYEFLAVIFHCCTARHCIEIFKKLIVILSACLRRAVPWPTKEEISRNLPACFKDFENVRVVLDCTEMKIRNPPNLCCELITYSHYKHAKTVKIMTGVTPAGNISFVSKAFGGRLPTNKFLSKVVFYSFWKQEMMSWSIVDF